MLQRKKKITKKELKHDPLLTTYTKATAYYYEYKKYIGYAITALLVIVIASVVYANNRRASNERAAAELGKIFSFFDAGLYREAVEGMPERGVLGLRAIVENYSGSSAQLARFYLANSYYKLGEYDEALKHFERFRGDTDLLRASAMAGAAACYEAMGDRGKAAKLYERAARRVADSPLGAEYFHLAAYNYGKAGETKKALDLFERIKKDYPNTTYARDADRFIVEFSI